MTALFSDALLVVGLLCLVVAAFLAGLIVGLLVLGVALLFLSLSFADVKVRQLWRS